MKKNEDGQEKEKDKSKDKNEYEIVSKFKENSGFVKLGKYLVLHGAGFLKLLDALAMNQEIYGQQLLTLKKKQSGDNNKNKNDDNNNNDNNNLGVSKLNNLWPS